VSLIARIRDSQFLRFAIIGGTGFLMSEAVLFVFLRILPANPYATGIYTVFLNRASVAVVLAFLVTVTYTWFGNRIVTFRDHAAKGLPAIFQEWLKFVVANALGFGVNLSVYLALITFARAPLNNPYLALACGTSVGLLFNFTLSKRLVFRALPPTV
jgi:putative flippase GtrA